MKKFWLLTLPLAMILGCSGEGDTTDGGDADPTADATETPMGSDGDGGTEEPAE